MHRLGECVRNQFCLSSILEAQIFRGTQFFVVLSSVFIHERKAVAESILHLIWMGNDFFWFWPIREIDFFCSIARLMKVTQR